MNKPKLKEFFRVMDIAEIDADSLEFIIGYTESTAHRVEGDRSVLKLLSLCDGQRTRADLYTLISEEYPNVSSEDIDGVLQYLFDLDLMEDGDLKSTQLTESELDRYSRHFVYYSAFSDNRYAGQEKLKNSRVVLIGMGGIGCWISYGLAASGVGTIVGADHDEIELSNLTRQILYTEADIGKKKVETAKGRLEALNSNVNFIPMTKEMTSTETVKEVIAGADFVILSADSPERIHYWVDEACYDLKIPYLNVGYLDTWGAVGPLTVPDVTSCLLCEMGTDEEVKEDHLLTFPEVQAINGRSKAPSFGPLNGLVSCFASMEVIKYLTGYETPVTLGKRYLVNTGTMESELEDYPKKSDCVRCGCK